MAVKECTCINTAQDYMHGKKMRVHNRLQGQKKRGWRCTACGDEKLTNVEAKT